MVNRYYQIFTSIAIVLYIILALFIAVNILIKSTGREKEKYKAMMIDWVKGIMLLFFMPYMIKCAIMANEGLVGLVYTNVIQNSGGSGPLSKAQNASPSFKKDNSSAKAALGERKNETSNGDLMILYRNKTLDTGNLVYGLVYIFLLKQLLGLLLMYFRRMISVLILIVVFPFIAVTYAVDKIKDGQAQIYNSWLKELFLNIFMQFFQAIVYCAIMFLVGALLGEASSGANVLMMTIAINFITKSETLLRSLFPSFMSGGQGVGTVKPLSQEVKAMTNTAIFKKAKNTVTTIGKRVDNMSEKHLKHLEDKYAYREDKNIKDEAWRNKAATRDQVRRIGRTDFSELDEEVPRVRFDTPEDDAERIKAERKAALDRRAQMWDDLNYCRHSTNPNMRKRFDDYMAAQASDADRERILGQMDAKERINEVVTGRNRSGRKMSQKELSISARIVVDIVRSGQPGHAGQYSELGEWMQGKSIRVEERVFNGGRISEEEALRRKAAGQRVSETRVTRQVRLSDYLDADGATNERTGNARYLVDSKTGERTGIRRGKGLQGIYVSQADSEKMSDAMRLFGGKTQGISTTKTDDLDTQFVSSMEDMTGETRLVDERGLDASSRVDEEKERQQVVLSEDELHQLWVDQKDEIGEFARTHYKHGQTREAREEIDEAADLLYQLHAYMSRVNSAGGQAGMSAAEAYRISSRLNELGIRNDSVSTMIGEATGAIQSPRGSFCIIRINMHGVTLSQMEAASGAGVVLENRMLKDKERKAYTASAIRTLGRKTDDTVIAGIVARAGVDDLIGDESIAEVSDDGKIKREGKSPEELLAEQYEREIAEKEEAIRTNRIAQSRARAFSSGLQAAGAIASTIAGEPLRMAAGISAAAFTAGGSDEPEVSGIVGGYEFGAGLEESMEKAIPGTTSAGSSGTLGSFIADVPESVTEGATRATAGARRAGRAISNTARAVSETRVGQATSRTVGRAARAIGGTRMVQATMRAVGSMPGVRTLRQRHNERVLEREIIEQGGRSQAASERSRIFGNSLSNL
jgi:hypothetical protein